MLSSDDIVKVIKQLVGPISPIGDTYIDDDRYQNLIVLSHVTEKLVKELLNIRQYGDRPEDSVLKAVRFSKKQLANIANDILDQCPEI